MFERATKKLVQQIDPDGSLIASRLNDSEKLQLLAVVLKKHKGWFWQQTKYRPTSFSLNDLLEGDEIKPVREEKEFVKYEGTYKNVLSGSVEVGNRAVGMTAKGKVRSKLCLSLGTLKREDINLQRLLKDCRGRKLDLSHSLIKQSLKSNKVFTLLKERIFTTRECSISYTGQEQGSCYSGLRVYSEISMQESGKVENNSVVAMEIPPGTVMAYSVITMSISSDGYFGSSKVPHSSAVEEPFWFPKEPFIRLTILELCVAPGGIGADDTSQNLNFSVVDGPCTLQKIQEGNSFSSLKNALLDVQSRFGALANLSRECRSSLLLLLRKILLNRPVLSALVDRLEELSTGEAPFLCQNELPDEQSHLIGTFLDLLKCKPDGRSETTTASVTSSNQNGSHILAANHSSFGFNGCSPKEKQNGCHTAVFPRNGTSTKAYKQTEQLLIAVQMLLSALEELTDAGLTLLEHFCSAEGLKSLQDLVNLLLADSIPLSKDSIPVFLQEDDEFCRMEELFKSCNVLLRIEAHLMFAEVTCEGFLPLVLCIVISGLECLNVA